MRITENMNNNRDMLLVGYAFLLVLVAIFLLCMPVGVDGKTKLTCEEWGSIRQKEYSGTKWENMDFERSCIENVVYANPYNRK